MTACAETDDFFIALYTHKKYWRGKRRNLLCGLSGNNLF